FMIHGSQDSGTNLQPYGAIPQGAVGLFGGYGTGYGGVRALFGTSGVLDRLAEGSYPASPAEIIDGGWGELAIPPGMPKRIPLIEHSIVADFTQSGGGFGDPLLRDPRTVALEVHNGRTSLRTATDVYGVVLADDGTANDAATADRRQAMRAERLHRGRIRATAPPRSPHADDAHGPVL